MVRGAWWDEVRARIGRPVVRVGHLAVLVAAVVFGPATAPPYAGANRGDGPAGAPVGVSTQVVVDPGPGSGPLTAAAAATGPGYALKEWAPPPTGYVKFRADLPRHVREVVRDAMRELNEIIRPLRSGPRPAYTEDGVTNMSFPAVFDGDRFVFAPIDQQTRWLTRPTVIIRAEEPGHPDLDGAAGMARVQMWGWGDRVVDVAVGGSIVLSTRYTQQPEHWFLRELVRHELGHIAGLDHYDGLPRQVMASVGRYPYLTRYQDGDRAGIRRASAIGYRRTSARNPTGTATLTQVEPRRVTVTWSAWDPDISPYDPLPNWVSVTKDGVVARNSAASQGSTTITLTKSPQKVCVHARNLRHGSVLRRTLRCQTFSF
jgi:hypothetical protein